MLTIKRRYVTAQVVFDLLDDNGDFAEEVVTPKFMVRRGEEAKLSFMADKLAEKLWQELNQAGKPAVMAPGGSYVVAEGGNGKELSKRTSDRETKPSRARKGAGRAECGAGASREGEGGSGSSGDGSGPQAGSGDGEAEASGPAGGNSEAE